MRLVHNSLHDEVAAQLRDRIFDGELLPGSFLDEASLCRADAHLAHAAARSAEGAHGRRAGAPRAAARLAS